MIYTDKLIWDIVEKVASVSECLDRKVGCIIYHKKLGTIVGTGFNMHLNGICDCDTGSTAQHAEVTAVHDLLGPYNKEDLVAYVNHKPCCNCASILSKTVKEVRYRDQKE